MFKKFCTGLILTLLCLSMPLSAAAKSPGLLSAKPAINSKYDRERSWLIYDMKPGEVLEDAIIVSNSLGRDAVAWVYPGDSTSGSDGGFAIKQGVEEQKSVGKWIELDTSEVNLKSGDSKLVKFKITIPKTGVDVGEHRGGIMIEEKVDENAEVPGGVSIRQRTGVRVYVTIPGEVVRNFKPIGITKSVREERKSILPFGVPTVLNFRAGVESFSNVGVVGKYDFTVNEALFGLNSVENVNFAGVNLLSNMALTKDQRVERDAKHATNFDWDAPLFGRYKAAMTFSYDVDLKNENPGDIVKIDLGEVVFWVIPWDIIIALILLSLAYYFHKKRKNRAVREVTKKSAIERKPVAKKKASTKKIPAKKAVTIKKPVKRPATKKK